MGRKINCDYNVTINGNFITIEDENLGRTSVTNAIEEIIDIMNDDLKKLEKEKIRVIYKDSENIWSEIKLNEDLRFKCFT